MCTVTFIPVNKKVFITHSRDEHAVRAKALAPALHNYQDTTMVFPKDGKAGGSWAGFNEFGHAAVLLNGAFKKHDPDPPYRRSRGLIFLDLLSSADLLIQFQSLTLERIEPFTVIFWNGKALYELRWDAERKHILKLDETEAHMWSSATLYDESIVNKRLSWFTAWKEKHPAPLMEDIIKFHLTAGEGDGSNDLRMNRNGELLTQSITAIELSRQSGRLRYIDLPANDVKDIGLTFEKSRVKSQ